MRMIDADKLVDEMKNTSPNAYTVGQMIYLAENAPTAYDVDKVLEEIIEYADNVAELGGNFLPEVVIKILKGGGLDDRK